ncbi:MAG: hypothetical protein QM764_16865 [Chitinophagaceae bacterium]
MMTKILATQFFDERIATLFPEQFDIISEDVEQMARHCNRLNEGQIIILTKNRSINAAARTLADKVKDKTILLVSLENSPESEDVSSLMNLGAAIAFAQTLSLGIYIIHNNKYYYWNEIVMETDKNYLSQAVA